MKEADRLSPLGAAMLRVAQANTGIRSVIDLSRQISVASINAGLVARRVGNEARGFGIVAGELRSFSQWLENRMDELGQLIDTQVIHLAGLARDTRNRDLIARAVADCGAQAPDSLAASQARLAGRLDAANDLAHRHWQALERELGRIARFCGNGSALTRAARIEAVHGGHFRVMLGQVVDEVESAVGSIRQTLRDLARETAKSSTGNDPLRPAAARPRPAAAA